MKCPLLAIATAMTDSPHWLQESECLGRECAWWDTVNECCFYKTAVRSLRDISFSLKDIERKLPSYERLV